MSRQVRQYAAADLHRFKGQRALLIFLLSLMCWLLAGCQTIQHNNSVLKDLQEWSTPEPLDRLSPPGEQMRAKAAMVRWTEQYLNDEYRVVDQRFVLTAPGSTDGAAIGSKVNQYVTQISGGVLQINGWYGDDAYRLFLFAFDDVSPRHIAFVMTRDFLPGTRDRRLVGYFELATSAKR